MEKRSKIGNLGIFLLVLGCVLLVLFLIGQNKRRFSNSYQARNIYVYDMEEKKPILKKREKDRVKPASLTKMMTCLVAIENIEDLNEIAPVDKSSYQDMIEKNASMAGFYGNERTTYRDLIYGAMLASGGECAKSLAINVGGDEESFVNMMNQKAEELGMDNSHFTNSEGMDDEDQYTSAEDMCKLICYGLKNEKFRQVFTTEKYRSSKTPDHPDGLEIESRVLKRLDGYEKKPYKIIGGKSGTTEGAGLCWATLSEKNDREYIIIVMGVPMEDLSKQGDGQIKDSLKILDEI